MTREEGWQAWIMDTRDEIVDGFTIMGWLNKAYTCGWDACEREVYKAPPEMRCGTCLFYDLAYRSCKEAEKYTKRTVPASIDIGEVNIRETSGQDCIAWKPRKEG